MYYLHILFIAKPIVLYLSLHKTKQNIETIIVSVFYLLVKSNVWSL